MALEFETPAPALASFVNAYIVYDEKEVELSRHILPLGTQFVWFVMAGSVTMRSKLRGDISIPRMSMLGFITHPFRTSHALPSRVVAINLKPYGCHALFGLEMVTYQDYFYDMAPLKLCEGLYERLAGQSDMAGIKAVLDEWLSHCISETAAEMEDIAGMLAAVHAENGRMSEDALRTAFDVTEGELVGIFNRCVGVSPKLYLRLYRFNCVIGQLDDAGRTLEDLIGGAGYPKNAHFIKDFLRFTNCGPAVLRLAENLPLSRERLKEIMLGLG